MGNPYSSKSSGRTFSHVAAQVLHCVAHVLLGIICLLGALSNLVFAEHALMGIFLAWLALEALVLVSCFPLRNRGQKAASICVPLAGFLAVSIHAGVQLHQTELPVLTAAVDTDQYEPFHSQKLAALDHAASLSIEQELPRLDGSTDFYPLYAAFVQATYPEGSYPATPVWDEAERRYVYPNATVLCSGNAGAFESLLNGTADIIFCEAPVLAQWNQAERSGKTLSCVPVAKDALVLFANARNPVTGLTRQQAQGIYSGLIANWQAVGGKDQEIRAYQEPAESASHGLLLALMDDMPLAHTVLAEDGTAPAPYKNYRNAIGCSSLSAMRAPAARGEIRLLSLDGTAPDDGTVTDGTYRYAQAVYAITTDMQGLNALLFLNWILSPEGQTLVERSGFIPVAPTEESTPPPKESI